MWSTLTLYGGSTVFINFNAVAYYHAQHGIGYNSVIMLNGGRDLYIQETI